MDDYLGLEAFDDARRLIVVAAHPDDLETMCGGTIALLAQRKVEIFSVNCTLGDIGAPDDVMSRHSLASVRLAETGNAAQLLGIRCTFNLGHPDGELLAGLELRAQIARLYRITQADTVLTFDPYWTGQIHPDHRAAGQAALDAFMPSKMPLYHPEQFEDPRAEPGAVERLLLFSTDREPDVYMDVTAIYHTKLEACMAHISQFPDGEDSLEWMKEIDRADGERIGVTYAESFRRVELW